MSNCVYPGCMMGGGSCKRERQCEAEDAGLPWPPPKAAPPKPSAAEREAEAAAEHTSYTGMAWGAYEHGFKDGSTWHADKLRPVLERLREAIRFEPDPRAALDILSEAMEGE